MVSKRAGALPRFTSRARWGLVPPRSLLFLVLLVLYVGLVAAVVVGSPLDWLDRWVRSLPLDRQAPGWRHVVLDYVMLGQRGPSTAVASVWILWLCRARRSWDPLITFVTALLLLNLSVGVVKLGTGRWGPRITAHAHDVLAGGDIFPSGHTSNAVVLFGALAMLAVRHRKTMTVLAAWVSFSVGLSTLYLDTHWVTDVLGGWLAGALVLLVVPRTAQLVKNGLRHSRALSATPVSRFRSRTRVAPDGYAQRPWSGNARR